LNLLLLRSSSQSHNEYLLLPLREASLWNFPSYAAGVRVCAGVLVVAVVTARAVVGSMREMKLIMIHKTI
jgi:hypothetical protein